MIEAGGVSLFCAIGVGTLALVAGATYLMSRSVLLSLFVTGAATPVFAVFLLWHLVQVRRGPLFIWDPDSGQVRLPWDDRVIPLVRVKRIELVGDRSNADQVCRLALVFEDEVSGAEQSIDICGADGPATLSSMAHELADRLHLPYQYRILKW